MGLLDRLPSYAYQRMAELGWAVVVGVGTVVAQALIEFDEAVLDDPETWLVGLGAAAVRAVGAALLAQLKPGA